MKINVILGTRPEIIRLSAIIKFLDKLFELKVIHTGQNYDPELSKIFFDDLGLREPDFYLDLGKTSSNSVSLIGEIISGVDQILEETNPDCVLVLGDTNSALGVLGAKKRKIPIFHYEAGNRCFDERVPEEINRKIVDHISDINLTYSEFARQNLLKEGLPQDRVINIGSPMREVIDENIKKINGSSALKSLALEANKYFMVTFHREENLDLGNNLNNFASVMDEISKKYDYPILMSIHPRTEKKLEHLGIKLHSNVKTMKPFNFSDFITLQKNSIAVLSDSGTITEESSILKFPAINLRESFERQEGLTEGNVFLTGLNKKLIIKTIDLILSKSLCPNDFLDIKDYSPPNISKKLPSLLISLTDFINREVYKKY
jgi:UDP-N-acetylglucosamine 2-epimerase (non-hydrolysing)